MSALLLSASSSAFAQMPPASASSLKLAAAEKPSVDTRISEPGRTSVSRSVSLGTGKTLIVELPADVRDVIVGNPKVAEVVMRTTRRAFIVGGSPGETSAFFLDSSGRQILNLELKVGRDSGALEEVIGRLTPSAKIKVETVGKNVYLYGTAPDASTADRALQIARAYVEEPKFAQSFISIEGQEQVLLRVRVVEMQRTLLKQLGFNLDASNFLNQLVGEDDFFNISSSYGYSIAGAALSGLSGKAGTAKTVLQPESVSVLSPLGGSYDPAGGLTGVAGYQLNSDGSVKYGAGKLVSSSKTEASIQAFERAGLMRTLAEPNLTAVSGESAKFLAGGEFPVPVAQDREGGISVSFKPYGVGLGFTPIVLSKGRISLRVSTEVSELTNEGAVRLGDRPIVNADGEITDVVRGLTIPALNVRRAETTVEMPSGGSLMMAGLIRETSKQAIEGIPGAKDIPVLGTLFRSRDFFNNETELVVIITPYLVKAVTMDKLKTPADGVQTASDLETILFGRLNKKSKKPEGADGDKGLKGPFGFKLD
ncbi:MAG: type II and III secretion system protein family protein [Caulobacterales bacterium]